MLLRRRSEANPAEVASRAAQEQGKFWEYHDVFCQSQVAENSGIFSDENLVGFAREAGLDAERFEESFNGNKYEPVVDRVFRAGQDAGINGTPTFFINGRLLLGAQPSKVFEQATEEYVRKSENG
jgi:predicted DsbA family dithiol-disulfide isomerase